MSNRFEWYFICMGELFWDEELEWEESPGEAQQQTPDKQQPNRANKIIRLAAAVTAVLGIGTYIGVEASAPGQTRESRLAWRFHEHNYSAADQAQFKFLTELTPKQVDEGVIEGRAAFGKKIQDAAARISLNGFAQGLDNQGIKVDMYDLVEQLVQPETQAQMRHDGIEFSGMQPVDCDAPAPNGDHGYDPLDYSNHPPTDLKVITRIENGKDITTVPLGTEEMPSTADIFVQTFGTWDFYENASKMSFDATESCVDLYPHQIYPPNDTTYPPGTNYTFSLW